MRIIKLRGKTEDAIMRQIERDYKENAIVLSTQKEEATGHFKWFKSPHVVVTVAVKEENDESATNEISKEQYITPNKQEEKDEASYKMLMELKDQLGQLHEEIGELKQVSMTHETVLETSDVPVNIKEDKLINCIKEKLLGLGIKPEICTLLFEKVDGEDSETIIRQLYSALEDLLREQEPREEKPQIVFFIGSTGVGKTTTLAKITAKYVLEEQKNIVLFTSDTYRIAAVEQLKTYADILGVPIEIIYDESELPTFIEKWKDADHILIDTAGRSHKNEEQVKELKGLMQQIEEKEVFLVLNASTAGKDVKKIVKTYEQAEEDFSLIVTKLDETDELGNIVNINYYAQKPISYITNGQNVPADIKNFDKQDYITELLGRLNDE